MRRRGDRTRTAFSRGFLAVCLGCAVLAGCVPATGPAQSPTPPPDSDSPAPSSAETPDAPAISLPPPRAAGKVTLPVSATFQWDASKPIALGDPGQFHLAIRPQISVASLKVMIEATGAVELLSGPELTAGPIAGGAEHRMPIKARVNTPGRVELRARVVGSDPEGGVLFESSYPLYLLAVEERVLVGVDGFAALEQAELDRRKDSGALDDATYEREKRRIHGGGARESITVTPAAPQAAASN